MPLPSIISYLVPRAFAQAICACFGGCFGAHNSSSSSPPSSSFLSANWTSDSDHNENNHSPTTNRASPSFLSANWTSDDSDSDENNHSPTTNRELYIYSANIPLPRELIQSDDCVICLENIERKKIAVLPKCSHMYHVSCVVPWITLNWSCPICREAVVKIIVYSRTCG